MLRMDRCNMYNTVEMVEQFNSYCSAVADKLRSQLPQCHIQPFEIG